MNTEIEPMPPLPPTVYEREGKWYREMVLLVPAPEVTL